MRSSEDCVLKGQRDNSRGHSEAMPWATIGLPLRGARPNQAAGGNAGDLRSAAVASGIATPRVAIGALDDEP